jgi:hypothetical protein
MGGCAVVALAGFTIFVVVAVMSSLQNDSPEPAGAPTPAVDKSAAFQDRRAKLIEDLQGQGVFGKVECRQDAGTAWVKPGFYTLSFDDKQSFVSVVLAYCTNAGDRDFVVLKDDRTGKEVGTLWGNRGLEME